MNCPIIYQQNQADNNHKHHFLNSLHIIANKFGSDTSANTTKFYNVHDNDEEEDRGGESTPSERGKTPFDQDQRKPTINEKLDHINMSLDQVKHTMTNHPITLDRQTSNDDIELLKARIDNIEVMLESQNKLISDIESNIKHCIYQIYCKL